MNYILVSMDNGLEYEDSECKPVAICLNKEASMKYIDTHPITEKLFEDVFYYLSPNSLLRARYVIEEVPVFQHQ